LGILLAIISSVSILLGLTEMVVVPIAFVASIFAAFIGIIGLWHNRREGLFREDPLYMMLVLLYFGLLIYAIGEAAIAARVILSDDVLINYLPSMTRMFGMIFWLLGLMNYVRATNHVLEYIDSRIWFFLILTCCMSVIIVLPGIYLALENTSVITIINLVIFTIGIAVMTCFMLYLLWIFRKGEFKNMLLSVFSCLFFLFIRSVIIVYSTDAILDVIALTLALEAYLCLWISESLFFRLVNA
jgi:hypothetical protein